MPTQQVPLMTPEKGVVRAVGREGQPPDTCWDAKNVLPYDRYGRKRVAQRGGLLRQFPDALAASFVQGMIEAPNIIYPPGAISIPFGTLDDLTDWPGPDFPGGTVGPFPYNGPTFTTTLEWEFTFSFTCTVAATPTSTPWATNSYGGEGDFFITVGSGPADNILIGVQGGGFLNEGGSTPTLSVLVAIGYGTWASPTIVQNLHGTLTHPGDGATSGTASGSVTVLVRSNGTIKVTLNPAQDGPYEHTVPISFTNFPELNCQQVTVDQPPNPGGGTNVSDVTVSVSITG